MWCADPWLISRCAAISFTVTRRFSFAMASTAAMPSGVTTGCAWPGWGQSVTELMPFMNFPVHPYTCCSDRHASPYWTFIRRWISLLKKRMEESCSPLAHVASGAALYCYCAVLLHSCIVLPPVGHSLYTTTAPSCYIPASYCHLSATIQTISITVVNFQTIELCFEFLSHF